VEKHVFVGKYDGPVRESYYMGGEKKKSGLGVRHTGCRDINIE
jgi:hypothetical protein